VKNCNLCGKIKPLSAYGCRSNSKDGHQYSCKPCLKSYRKAYHEKNREHSLKKMRQYNKDNKEFMAAYFKVYYTENRTILLERSRAYHRNKRNNQCQE